MNEETKVTQTDDAEKINLGDEGEALMKFELPPVSDQAGDFIEGDDAAAEAQAELEPPKSPDDYRGTVDDKGNEYDPAIHKYPPEKTRTGRWSKIRKRGEAAPTANAAYRGAAQQYAMLYGNAHVTLFGADGSIDKDALLPLVDAIEAYMVENGISELDPKWQIALAGVNYSTVICSRESNAEKIKRWFSPITGFFKKLFGFKKREKVDVEIIHGKQTVDKPQNYQGDGFTYPEAK